MTRKTPSNRHVRTRGDHATELAEDYVEAIAEIMQERGVCRVTDLASRFQVSHVTVNRAIKRLIRSGLVTSEPYAPIELTLQGAQLADRSRRRHEIVYEFLVSLGIDPQIAAVDAEGIEHHVSPETLLVMKRFAATHR